MKVAWYFWRTPIFRLFPTTVTKKCKQRQKICQENCQKIGFISWNDNVIEDLFQNLIKLVKTRYFIKIVVKIIGSKDLISKVAVPWQSQYTTSQIESDYPKKGRFLPILDAKFELIEDHCKLEIDHVPMKPTETIQVWVFLKFRFSKMVTNIWRNIPLDFEIY